MSERAVANLNFLRHLYRDGCLDNYVHSETSLDGHAKEFFRWLYLAASNVKLAADIGGNAHCYVGDKGHGLDALRNAKQFLGYATLYLDQHGAPK